MGNEPHGGADVRVNVRIHGVLSVAASAGDGPVEVPPGTTVEEFLA